MNNEQNTIEYKNNFKNNNYTELYNFINDKDRNLTLK